MHFRRALADTYFTVADVR